VVQVRAISNVRMAASVARMVVTAPLNSGQRVRALVRLIEWQVGLRILRRPVVFDFANQTRLLGEQASPGAALNLFSGLHEYEDMAFVCHCLRPGDLFVDVGANIGSYSVLAAGVAGARVVAFEPIVRTYESFLDNINLNRLTDLVSVTNAGVGSKAGSLEFLKGLGPMNRVVTSGDTGVESVTVPVVRLDDALSEPPTVLKIDVEGWEAEVLAGASETLTSPNLLAVIVELNGSGDRYGFSESGVRTRLEASGFTRSMYSPKDRTIRALTGKSVSEGNELYIRNMGLVADLVRNAPAFVVQGRSI
jgi:FkbM family methyltransferase